MVRAKTGRYNLISFGVAKFGSATLSHRIRNGYSSSHRASQDLSTRPVESKFNSLPPGDAKSS